jgi:hypothetical protein
MIDACMQQEGPTANAPPATDNFGEMSGGKDCERVFRTVNRLRTVQYDSSVCLFLTIGRPTGTVMCCTVHSIPTGGIDSKYMMYCILYNVQCTHSQRVIERFGWRYSILMR